MNIDMTKIKKTEKCPCGSGKLYRSCCFNAKDKDGIREDLKENSRYIENFIRNKFNESNIEYCFYPNKDECEGIIKNAHTLQNKRILSKLSEKGHVIVSEAKADKYGVRIEFVSKGKNEATTFTGFCHKHDTKLFVDIETKDYEELPKQNFLFAYRAFAQEYHKKMRLLKGMQYMFKNKPSLLKYQSIIRDYRYRQLEIFDMKEYKKIFDYILLNGDYDKLNSYVIKLDKAYDFAVTTMFNPNTDLKGSILNEPYSVEEKRQRSCFITVFPDNNETIIILSWLKEDDKFLIGFINQIKCLEEEKLKIYLNNILPMYTENLVLSPRLWNKTTNYSKKRITELVGGDFPRLDQQIDPIKLLESKYRYKEDFLSRPGFDLFK